MQGKKSFFWEIFYGKSEKALVRTVFIDIFRNEWLVQSVWNRGQSSLIAAVNLNLSKPLFPIFDHARTT